MNLARLRKLRAFLRRVPARNFDMTVVAAHRGNGVHPALKHREHLLEHGCGARACLAGYTVAIFAEEARVCDPITAAANLLGLSNTDARKLFFGDWESLSAEQRDRDLREYTKAEAIRELTRLIEAAEEWKQR